MKNTIFYWSSNNSSKSGEGVLAKYFLSDLKKFKKSKIMSKFLIIINLKIPLLKIIFIPLLEYLNYG
jgi:hypothetical protein